MIPRETLALMRFGFGPGPGHPPPADAMALLDALDGLDTAAARFPVTAFAEHLETARAYADAARARREGDRAGVEAQRRLNRARHAVLQRDLVHSLARAAHGGGDLRERLVLFWANHFTAIGRTPRFRATVPAYLDDAIRPNLGGDFATLLRAAILHPVMLQYLDQARSAGPASRMGQQPGRGLNENLARELLELHTLGADGAYGQEDVEGLARLLTGLGFDLTRGFRFRPGMAEPGRITVLGRSYGGRRPQLEDIEVALDDLARHPDTARHIARKLAVHFIADDPDPGLVAHVAAAFRDSGGALRPVYAALMEHPAAWAQAPAKIKPPFDFMASALRALGLAPERLVPRPALIVQHFTAPLRQMGQPFQQPPSPAGWPEAGDQWISPPGLAARIGWALTSPGELGELPDPRSLVETALAEAAGPDLRFAAAAAETRTEGVGLVLASPAFNRR